VASNSGKNPFDKGPVPTKPAPAAPPKPEPPAKATATRPLDQLGLGLLSLVIGCIALSLNAIPFLRILAVLMSLAGLGLAIVELRSPSKEQRHPGRAIAGAILCSFILLLTVIRPFWPDNIGPIAQVPTTATPRPTASSTLPAATAAQPTSTSAPETTTAAPQTTTSTPATVAAAPQNASSVPHVFPFPGGRHLQLIPSTADAAESTVAGSAAPHQDRPRDLQWVDASTGAAQQGEVTVSVASVTVERLKQTRAGKESSSPNDNLVIRVQVLLIGTSRKVDFEPWSNSNFGDARNKPTLVDNLNNAYQLRIFDAGTQIVDHGRPKSLYPKLYADDFLVFEVPHAKVEFLQLGLPASAFGGTGTVRFQIPKSMFEGVKESQPAK
jgi:hypothetical protein